MLPLGCLPLWGSEGVTFLMDRKGISKQWKIRISTKRNFSTKKVRVGEIFPAPFVLIALLWVVSARFHVVQYPVPHYQHAGDDHIGKQPRAEECSHDDEFVVHPAHLIPVRLRYLPRSRPCSGWLRPRTR